MTSADGIAATLEQFAGVADILLGGHEDQHIPPAALVMQQVHGLGRLLDMGALLAVVRQVLQIARLHRIHAAGDLDDRCTAKGLGEFFRIDGGRGDDHLQIPASDEQLFEQAQNEIDIQAALVGFIDNQRVVLVQTMGPTAPRPAGCRRSSA